MTTQGEKEEMAAQSVKEEMTKFFTKILNEEMVKKWERAIQEIDVACKVTTDGSMNDLLKTVLIKYPLNSIMSMEVHELVKRMIRFRNALGEKFSAEEEVVQDKILNPSKAIEEVLKGWKVWKEHEGEENCKELTYQTVRQHILDSH